MIKMQHAKRELNKQKIQNRQQKWIKLIIQLKKQTNKKRPEHIDSALGLGVGRGTKLGDRMYASQKVKATKSLHERKRKGKLYTLICTLYSMQLCKMAGAQLWHPVLNAPHLDGIYICVKSNACTQAGPTKNCYFQDRPHGRRGSDSI